MKSHQNLAVIALYIDTVFSYASLSSVCLFLTSNALDGLSSLERLLPIFISGQLYWCHIRCNSTVYSYCTLKEHTEKCWQIFCRSQTKRNDYNYCLDPKTLG